MICWYNIFVWRLSLWNQWHQPGTPIWPPYWWSGGKNLIVFYVKLMSYFDKNTLTMTMMYMASCKNESEKSKNSFLPPPHSELRNVKFFTQINSFQMNLPQEKACKSLRFFDLNCIKWAKKANFRAKLPKMISLTLF